MDRIYVPKFCDSGSILLVNGFGALRKLFCPFLVKTIVDVGYFKPGTQVWVEQVASTERKQLAYIIMGRCYLHNCFIIKSNL
jgi:hypothetical protein